MATLKIYNDSKNYTATIVKLSNPFPLQGLDNLVGVSVFGNVCIIPKTYDLDEWYVFFPSECVLSNRYLSENNLYKNSNLNMGLKSKGYFEENGRVKAIKFKGNKSTGVVMPIKSLHNIVKNIETSLIPGDEFNEINGVEICKKFVLPTKGSGTGTPKQNKLLDEIVDSKLFPQHFDTEHLLKNLDRLNAVDNFILTLKLHGTSARIGNTLIKSKLKWYEKLAKKLGIKVVEEEYGTVVGSRKVIKSVNFNELKNKNHFYEQDLWTKVGQQLEGQLHPGEIIYYEIIGKDFTGAEIQKGYSYKFEEPKIFIYRITHIDYKGFEIDLSWKQVIQRADELGCDVVPTLYEGSIWEYITQKGSNTFVGTWKEWLELHLKTTYLDKPAFLDSSVIEEGICLRIESYPRPRIYKLKSPLFLLHETNQLDNETIDVETQN